MKSKPFLYILVSYLILVIVSTIYWANNFSSYIKYKGDEFFFYAEYLLGLTTIFYLIQLFVIKVKRLALMIFVPLLTTLTSVFFGFIFLFITSMKGTPSETIYIYSWIYILSNVILLILVYSNSTKEKRVAN